MLPLLAFLAPAAATALETLIVATTTAVVTTVAVRATNDAYDFVTREDDED